MKKKRKAMTKSRWVGKSCQELRGDVSFWRVKKKESAL